MDGTGGWLRSGEKIGNFVSDDLATAAGRKFLLQLQRVANSFCFVD
jgi:hypothetical protein